MKKSLTILLAIILIIPLPFSCDLGQIGKYGPSKYRIQGMGIESGMVVKGDYYISIEPSNLEDTISSEVFGLRLFVDSISYISFNSNHSHANLFNSALADPAPPTPVTSISLISIYSSSDLSVDNTEYNAGDNLTSVFLASNGRSSSQLQSVLSFIDTNEPWYEWDSMFLHFNGSLDESISGTFTIKVTMDDGVVFELESEEVILQ